MNTDFLDDFSGYIAKELDTITASSSRLTFLDLLNRLQSLESEVLEVSQHLAMELRRRVAERTLVVAILKDCSLEICSEAFNKVSALGHTDLYQECMVTLEYCRLLQRHSLNREALELLNGLKEKATGPDYASDPEITDCIRMIDKLKITL